ncbi:sugar transferase [Arthrobacter sp.]|uniref:sugar transferase n=1 Tax=Arthrobacter sp. TaxID=1667 RepID=UPI0028122057|nr:sugar transferase [Arthrobacter sp.]
MRNSLYSYRTVKRALDLIFATIGLAVSAPAQSVIAVLVLLKHGRPIIFKQDRPGLHGETFSLLKFRSMKNHDEDGGLDTDEQRLTRFGRWLRSTSLDELPSLINVLKGDMSLVGPRPLLVKYLELYTPEQAHRHDVRPGVTGLAQVKGRNSITWEEKLKWDLIYVDHQSCGLDLLIVAETVLAVCKRSGISAEGSATMPEFRGQPEIKDRKSPDVRNDV